VGRTHSTWEGEVKRGECTSRVAGEGGVWLSVAMGVSVCGKWDRCELEEQIGRTRGEKVLKTIVTREKGV